MMAKISSVELKRMVEAGEITKGPIRKNTLSPELLEKIQFAHSVVGPFLNMNLETFEVGFMRDSNPEIEVNLWCGIALTFTTYIERNGNVSDEVAKKMIGALVGISMGMTDVAQMQVEPEVGNKLSTIWRKLSKGKKSGR